MDPLQQPAGSPVQGEPVFLVIGKLRHPHGLRGEIVMEVITDFPERLLPGTQVYLGQEHRPVHIRTRRKAADAILIAFDEYPDRESVAQLRNYYVYVRADDRPSLPEGEYYHHQIIGLQVISETGELLGKVEHIVETAAHDVLVVHSSSGAEWLIPFADAFILWVNLELGEVHVRLISGLRVGE